MNADSKAATDTLVAFGVGYGLTFPALCRFWRATARWSARRKLDRDT